MSLQKYNNFNTGKEYSIKIEIKQNQTRAHIFQNSSIIVKCFCVVLSNNRECKPFTEVNRAETVWISENFFFSFYVLNSEACVK